MHTPRTLLLAVAAVGLAGSASAAHAQFANVFVPELAMLDAMRRAPGAAGFSLLGLAQDMRDKGWKKSESLLRRLRRRAASRTALFNLLVH